MTAEVDWPASLRNWRWSRGKHRVVQDQVEIAAVKAMLEKFSVAGDSDVILFGDLTGAQAVLKCKQALAADDIDKSEVLSTAAKQLGTHKYLAETHLDERADGYRTYELPVESSHSKRIRYLKIKFEADEKFPTTPTGTTIIRVHYHVADPDIQAVYLK